MWKVECIDCHCHRCHELLVVWLRPPEDAEEHARQLIYGRVYPLKVGKSDVIHLGCCLKAHPVGDPG